jgi:hypothetical protein
LARVGAASYSSPEKISFNSLRWSQGKGGKGGVSRVCNFASQSLPCAVYRGGTEAISFSQAWVTHAYNPSYSGGRDQEDHGLKSAQAIFVRPYLEKTHHKT